MKDIGLQTSHADEHNYFYLYYRLTNEAEEEGISLDIPEFMNFLRRELDIWIKTEKGKEEQSTYKGKPEIELQKVPKTKSDK